MNRRRFLLAGSGLVGIAGCIGGDSQPTRTKTDSPTATESSKARASATPSDTPESTATDTESPNETEDEGPGYKQNHWHGRLFFEVNGELVNFRQPKYYLDNIEDENPEAVYFHFHEDPQNHGPNEWSNEKQIVTLERALNLLPDIGYARKSGAHAVTYDGTTYRASQSGTDISIHRGTEAVDPQQYEVQHDDDYWVQVTSQNARRSVSPKHGGADLATLVVDINHLRVDFSQEKFLGEDGGTEAFHFHDDGHPNLVYLEGSSSPTLADALNGLTDVTYEQSNGNHVLEYHTEEHPSHSRRYDAGRPEHEITIRQRATDVDPTSYEVSAGDIVWIYVESTVVPENEH